MGKNCMMLMIDLCRIPLHCFLAYIFIIKMDLELLGCALTVNLVYFLKFVVTKLVIDYYKKHDVALKESFYIRIDRTTLKGFRAFVKLASAGLLLSCLEWWISEAMTLLGGYISVNAQAASVIVNTIQMMMSYITLSFSYTMSSMIGSYLGEGNVK
jgi:Na+-driven multidrug efflux pump